MKNARMKIVLAMFSVLALTGLATRADDEELVLNAKLTGFQEVPSKLTNGNGTF